MIIIDMLSRAPLPKHSSNEDAYNVFRVTKMNNEMEMFDEFEYINSTEYLCASDDAKRRTAEQLSKDKILTRHWKKP